MHIKKDDQVEVITGRDRGVRGPVLSVDRQKGRVVVEGANKIWKHVARSQRNPQGGRLSKEAPLDASNVMLVCPACGAACRTGTRMNDDGTKVRFCKKCDANVGLVAPVRKP